ncbi:MAG: Rne/Rng family ribonuclease [Actinomycetota bacterium]
MAELKEIIISVDDFETRLAILEKGRLAEIYVERNDAPSIVGNIYLGRVSSVLPGMDAAFVDIGQEKSAFLCVGEVVFPEEVDSLPHKIHYFLKLGQDILVQVAKGPIGIKGARVTAQIALPGRHLVLLPFGDSVGVSRRLSEDERERLRSLCESIKPNDMGLIARTAAQGVGLERLKADLRHLIRTWRKLQRQAEKSKAPKAFYREEGLALRAARDIFTSNFIQLVIDSPKECKKIQDFLSKTSPELKDRVKLYSGSTPLFEKYDVDSQLRKALKRRIWLRSGGYITIDTTEALTAIDVNTGKYVGKTSLQRTILKTNLEAAREIADQIRLRDIGGIIVIDFIDMDDPKDREKVFSTLNEALAMDRAKTNVGEFSEFGLVEMTRKKFWQGLLESLYAPCLRCEGSGVVFSDTAAGIEAWRGIKRICWAKSSEALLFKVHPRVINFLAARRGKLRKRMGKDVYLYGDPTYTPEGYELVSEGSRREIKRAYKELCREFAAIHLT